LSLGRTPEPVRDRRPGHAVSRGALPGASPGNTPPRRRWTRELGGARRRQPGPETDPAGHPSLLPHLTPEGHGPMVVPWPRFPLWEPVRPALEREALSRGQAWGAILEARGFVGVMYSGGAAGPRLASPVRYEGEAPAMDNPVPVPQRPPAAWLSPWLRQRWRRRPYWEGGPNLPRMAHGASRRCRPVRG